MIFTCYNTENINARNVLAFGQMTKVHRGTSMNNIITRKCTKCGKVKKLDQFYKRKDMKDGFSTDCKECHAYRNRQFRINNPEKCKNYSHKWKSNNYDKVVETSHKYYEKNKDKINIYSRKWALLNPDKVKDGWNRYYYSHQEQERENSREYRINNIDKVNDVQRKWRNKNPDKVLQYNANRRSAKKNANGKVTAEEWYQLKERYNFTCLCCHKKESEIKLSLDHVIPLALGGDNTINNAQPLCLSCNSRKHTKVKDYRT